MATIAEIKDGMVEAFQPEKASGVNAVIQFDLTGDNGGQFYLDIGDGDISVHDGLADNPKTTIVATTEDYFKVATGELGAMPAVMSGKLKIKGDMGVAMKMQQMFKI
jgi:putative sterol carrier protein